MRTLDTLIEQTENALANLDAETEREMETIATDGYALTDRRITTTGRSFTGAQFPDYTAPYKAKKQKAGRYRGFVDLQFSGQMLASVGIIERHTAPGKVVVVLGGRDEQTRKKLEGNEKKRPGILKNSKEEIAILISDSQERFPERIASYFQ